MLRQRQAATVCRGRILLAEDDHDLRCLLAQTLELRGFDVCAVASGTRLLEELANVMVRPQRTPPYDVIVTDIRMPGQDGLSILSGLRRSGWTRPIVVISAFYDEVTRTRVDRVGATVMPKPIDPDALERTLMRVCGDAGGSTARRSVRVAIVEDDADIRAVMSSLLQLWGHEVVGEASSGTEGVDVLVATRPDVALIDIGLPGLDGYAVAKRVRATLAGECPRLVAMTGSCHAELAEDGVFDLVLGKPPELDALSAALASTAVSTFR